MRLPASFVLIFLTLIIIELVNVLEVGSFEARRSVSFTRKLVREMSNKLINTPESCVEDVVQGALLTDSRLMRVGNLNILVRADIDEVKRDKVTIISGGGSGHEPAHAGFIGDGLLSCAVLGNVFASPSVASIVAAIRTCAGTKGVLLIVKNYTGDRLNFGMAAEIAKQDGIDVMMVIVADDHALPLGKGITGGRGIAGTVFVHKVAGATANDATASLSQVHAAAVATSRLIGSMGVALSTCTVPGTAPSTRLLEPGVMEVGMGIHGEPGREQMKLPDTRAAKCVATLLVEGILGSIPAAAAAERENASHRTSSSSDDALKAPRLHYTDGQKVAVLLNNLGAVPVLEMTIVAKEIILLLRERGLLPVRYYTGPYMTSLEMNGVSLSLLLLDTTAATTTGDLTALLDKATTAPAWVASPKLTADSFNLASRSIAYNSPESERSKGTSNVGITAANATTTAAAASVRVLSSDGTSMVRATKAICEKIVAMEPKLTEYDAICGDGDCGVVMKKGALRVLADVAELEAAIAVATTARTATTTAIATAVTELPVIAMEVAPFFNFIADSVSASMGGTSGALLELCFRAMAASIATMTATKSPAGMKEMTIAFAAGVEAIKYYGGASKGFRTMLDALIPAVEALQNGGTVQDAAEAALAGAEATKFMGSLAGRSNYVSEENMRGVPDPGAAAIAEAFAALADSLR